MSDDDGANELIESPWYIEWAEDAPSIEDDDDLDMEDIYEGAVPPVTWDAADLSIWGRG